MVIAGAGGLAREILEIFARSGMPDTLCFFDDVTADAPPLLFDRFSVLRSSAEAASYFKQSGDTRFVLGLGSPAKRRHLSSVLEAAGGTLASVISPDASIGTFGMDIGTGCSVLPGAVITTHVKMGKGVLVNPHVSVSHGCTIGDFAEFGPGARVTGGCVIGHDTVLGTNASILPNVHIGSHVVIAAGAVVTRNVPDRTMVAGVPAVIKKHL